MCTVEDFSGMVKFASEYVMDDRIYPVEDNKKQDNPNLQFRIYCDNILCNGISDNVDSNMANFVMTLDRRGRLIYDTYFWIVRPLSTYFVMQKLLSNIHTVNQVLRVHCNTGVATTNKMRTLEGYELVWYYADGIANIMSLHRVSGRFHVEYDSKTTVKVMEI